MLLQNDVFTLNVRLGNCISIRTGNANDCAGGLSLNGRCYQRKSNLLTWYSARNECLEVGGDLASFETLSDSTFNITLGSTLLANTSVTEYWVGMQSVEWRWEDTGNHNYSEFTIKVSL